jgi:molybdopterin-guanine dinucleotide biosynthesis protein A
MRAPQLGIVSAGGLSTRFGSPKALAQVGGERVVDRAAAALREVVGADNVRCIANDAELGAAIGLPFRGDVLVGRGALAGLHAALVWARDEFVEGALIVGCDMPFIAPSLLQELLQHTAEVDVVIPESTGPRGVEPLCAWYGINCIAAIEAAAARGDARMIGFHDAVRVHRLPLERVNAHGDSARLFMNLNSPADLSRAEALEAEP